MPATIDPARDLLFGLLALQSRFISTRKILARIGDPDLGINLTHVGSAATQEDDDRTASYAVGSATSDGHRFRVLRPHAPGGLEGRLRGSRHRAATRGGIETDPR